MVDLTKWTASTVDRGNGFRALVELSPDFIAVVDRAGVLKYISPAVKRVSGFAPEELVGKTFTDFVDPDDMDRASQYLDSLLHSGDLIEATLQFRNKDGSRTSLATLSRALFEVPDIDGILVSARDVTRHVEWERALKTAVRESEDLYENAPCGYHTIDSNGTITRINKTELAWLQYTREEVVGKMKSVDLLTADGQNTYARLFSLLKEQGFVGDIEMEAIRKDRSIFTVLVSATAILDSEGRFLGSRTTVFDITERKHTELALRRLNRALRMLSTCNEELIRGEDQPQLLHAICRVAVEIGGYRMAWVGWAERDERRSVRPAAQAGFEDGYLGFADITWADTERGHGPTGMAIRTGDIQIVSNILADPRMSPWRAEAVKRGYNALIALPLKGQSGILGALTIYASESDAFPAEEIKLLRELADDLAFGIDTLRTRSGHRKAEEALAHLAHFDSLTGLANRAQLLDRTQKAIGDARSDGHHLALLALRLNRYSDLQAGLGVHAADELLRGLTLRLKEALQEAALLARIGDETFAVLLSAGDVEEARQLAQRVLGLLREPFQLAGISVDTQMSIGAAIFPGHGTDADVLLLRSQLAARHAFSEGAAFAVYQGPTDAESPRRLALIGELRRAIEADHLVLHYQPKIDIRSGRMVGVEALVRWQHPDRGLIPPDEFIPLSEQTGLVKPLTYWVINAALSQAFAWTQAGQDIPIAVNVPAASLRDPGFLGRVSELLEISGVRPDRLQIEITETAMMEDTKHTHLLLEQLRALGVRIFVDDFGTGYSSLAYIASLPIDALKIDRSFIIQMLVKPRILSVVEATIPLAHALKIKVVAEGVESIEQAQELMRMSCDEIQGFYFSRPLAGDKLGSWASGFALENFGLSASGGVAS